MVEVVDKTRVTKVILRSHIRVHSSQLTNVVILKVSNNTSNFQGNRFQVLHRAPFWRQSFSASWLEYESDGDATLAAVTTRV